MKHKDIILFTGGGTGGHVFPGLAVIEELRKQGFNGQVGWIGSTAGMERKLIKEAGLPFYGIPAGKLRRYVSLRNFFDLFKIALGLIASLFLLARLRPRLLFSKGGYVTVPPVMAAGLLKIPVLTHESDSDPGMATRLNSRWARGILTSFPETAAYFSTATHAKVIYTGNPVRPAILCGEASRGLALVGCPTGRPLILVLGGSLGSAAVNAAILANLEPLTRNYFVVHQMGNKGYTPRVQRNYYPAPFFGAELADLLAAADLVISRAGSNTLWELAATATPAILIPLPAKSSRGDQLRNARLFAQKGAAEMLEEKDLESRLLEIILKLMDNEAQRVQMQARLAELSPPDAAAGIAKIVLKESVYAN